MNATQIKTSLFSLTLLAGATFSAGVVQAADLTSKEVVEAKLTHVFIPREGFDDNDNVQAVIRGELPNACYSVGQAVFSVDAEKKLVQVAQTAILDRGGVCADPANLPPDLSQPIPFVRELNFGSLQAADYNIVYQTAAGEKLRSFHVGFAPTNTVDSARYALITNAFAQDVVERASGALEFRITGYINSSCAELSQFVVEKLDDVYVLLPKVQVKGDYCLPVNKPFYRTVTLEAPEAGFYLLHARSLAGQSANKVFQVTE